MTPTGPSAVDLGPFFLDLRTGERTPLPANLAGGYYYRASPDGTRIVYNGCCSTTDEMRLANVDGTHVRTLGSPEGLSYYGARWSPDGSKLLYQQREPGSLDLGNLFVKDLDGPRRTRLTDVTLPWAQWWFISAGFHPDGQHVIYHLPRGRPVFTTWDVWSVPVGGGESRLVLRNASFPAYFPDGEHIAFVSQATTDAVRGHFGGRRIAIASVDDPHSRRTLVRSNGLIWWPAMSPDGSRIAYQVDGTIYVLDVATGDSSPVAFGELADWFDDETLIVNPG